MVKTTSKKSYVKASAANPTCKPTPGYKNPGIDPEIRFYDIEDSDNTGDREESEILVIHDSSLAAYTQNLVKRKFPYIDTFDHEGPTVVSAMRNLTSGVFEHLDIIPPMDVDKRVA